MDERAGLYELVGGSIQPRGLPDRGGDLLGGDAMKPSWDDAPEWARFFARDSCGTWYWYENQPLYDGHEWYANGNFEEVGSQVRAKDSLEPRP